MRLRIPLMSFICFLILACGNGEKIRKGNEIEAKIENFKVEKGRLPESLTEVGIVGTESGSVYYKKESQTKYILWFGKELGESEVYDSETKKWK